MTAERLTVAMRRELRWIGRFGQPGDLADYGSTALAFYARERTLAALIRRGLIENAETITAAGRAAIAEEENAR